MYYCMYILLSLDFGVAYDFGGNKLMQGQSLTQRNAEGL